MVKRLETEKLALLTLKALVLTSKIMWFERLSLNKNGYTIDLKVLDLANSVTRFKNLYLKSKATLFEGSSLNK